MTLKEEIQTLAALVIVGGIGSIVFAFIATGNRNDLVMVGLGGVAAIIAGTIIFLLTIRSKKR